MDRARSYKPVGAVLLLIGAVLLGLGFLGGQGTFRIPGAVLAFFGIVLLARARRRI
jgi:hypothetical protein